MSQVSSMARADSPTRGDRRTARLAMRHRPRQVRARGIGALGDRVRGWHRSSSASCAASALSSEYSGWRCASVPEHDGAARAVTRARRRASDAHRSPPPRARPPAPACRRPRRRHARPRRARPRDPPRRRRRRRGNRYSKARGLRNATFAPPLTAALRIRCASIGISWRRFEPTTSTPSSASTSAIFSPRLGIGGLALLRAKIQLPQTMIDVAAAEAARDSRQQVHLLHRGHRRGQESQARGAVARGRLLQAFRRRRQRHFPIDGAAARRRCAPWAASTRSGEYMPSKPKRSRSAIQVSLISSFSRGTTRISLPRSTCA